MSSAVHAETMYLTPSQSLVGVQKERHSRKKDGKDVCYLIIDHDRKIVLMTQKLSAVSAFINTHLVPSDEPWTRVTTVGLWEVLDQTGGRVGGWHKGRWRVMSVDLESASVLFESVRKEHEEAAVVGIPACYQVCVQ